MVHLSGVWRGGELQPPDFLPSVIGVGEPLGKGGGPGDLGVCLSESFLLLDLCGCLVGDLDECSIGEPLEVSVRTTNSSFGILSIRLSLSGPGEVA